MKSREKRRRRRDRLWTSQGGLCHWCGKPMRHWTECPEVVSGQSSGPDDVATIDHLRDRFDPRRNTTARGGEQRWVLAHQKCNADRGKARQAAVIKERRLHRSKRAGKVAA